MTAFYRTLLVFVWRLQLWVALYLSHWLTSPTFLLGMSTTALFVFHILESLLVRAAKGTHLRVDDLAVEWKVWRPTCSVITGYGVLVWEDITPVLTCTLDPWQCSWKQISSLNASKHRAAGVTCSLVFLFGLFAFPLPNLSLSMIQKKSSISNLGGVLCVYITQACMAISVWQRAHSHAHTWTLSCINGSSVRLLSWGANRGARVACCHTEEHFKALE